MKPRTYLSPSSSAPAPGTDPTAPEAIVRVVLEKSPLLVYIVNLDFKVVLANRSLREVTGYDTSDCPNVDALIEQFYPHGDEYKKRVHDIHLGWRRNEHVMGAKLLVQCKNGTQRTIAWYTSRLRIGRGPTVGYVAMGLDLTTQGTLEQWVDLLQRTLQHLSEGVILTDSTGAVLAWNEGATRLLGYTESSMQGQPLEQLFPPTQRAALVREIDEAIGGPDGRFADELELVRTSGGTRDLAFVQVRLDGEGGAPLARLTVLAPPESEGDDLIAKAAALEGKLQVARSEADDLRGQHATLAAKVSTMDAELATQGAAAGQIADLRGQLQVALADAEKAQARVAELEARGAVAAVAAGDDGIPDVDDVLLALDVSDLEVVVDDEATRKSDPKPAADVAPKADLEAAQAELAAAKAELKEAQALVAAGDELLADADGGKKAAEAERDAAKAELDEASAALEAAKTELAEAKAALETAHTERDAGTEGLAAVKEELAAATSALEAATAERDALQAELDGAKEGLATTTSSLEALREEHEVVQKAHDDGQEAWVLERSKLEDEHRAAVEALATKAAEQRRSLEAQLHKDILAAEERAELEHQKLVERFASEKKDMAQAAEIAHAQIEARSNQLLDELRAEIEQSPSLQRHLAPVSAAVVSADTEGTVIGWSAGAEELEGRAAEEAIGKVIFDDVLALRGLKWKSLFGKVVVGGSVEKDVSLRRADGTTREVTLRARLVRSEAGAPLGVTAEVEEQRVAPSAVARQDAALLRLLAPLREQMALQTAAAVQEMQATAERARQLEQLGRGGEDVRLDDLVAQVAEVAGPLQTELGSDAAVGATGRALTSLLFALVRGKPAASLATNGAAAVEVRGVTWSPAEKREHAWLAREGGLGLTFKGQVASIDLVAPPREAGVPSEAAATDLSLRPKAVSPDDSEETSDDGGALDDLELDEPETSLDMAGSDDEIDLDPEEDDPDLVRSGRVRMANQDGDDLEVYAGEVYAGEDSIIKSEDVVYMAVNSLAEVDPVLRTSEGVVARKGETGPISGDLPPIDDLEEISGLSDGVSPALLNTAGAMDAYVAGNTVADDDLADAASTGAAPSEAVRKELATAEDAGPEEPIEVDTEKPPPKPSKKRRRSRKRKG